MAVDREQTGLAFATVFSSRAADRCASGDSVTLMKTDFAKDNCAFGIVNFGMMNSFDAIA